MRGNLECVQCLKLGNVVVFCGGPSSTLLGPRDKKTAHSVIDVDKWMHGAIIVRLDGMAGF